MSESRSLTSLLQSVAAFELMSAEEDELLHDSAVNSSRPLPELLRDGASHRMQVKMPGTS